MERLTSATRRSWQQIVESQGLHYHTMDDRPYWDESACYRFTEPEIDQLEQATYVLDKMCLAAVDHAIEHGMLLQLGVPERFVDFVVRSWEQDERTLYGRFDFAFDGVEPPKLLEFNADTPTALLEAAVVQWFWLQDVHPEADQFNSIHERLIEAWTTFRSAGLENVAFTSMRGQLEDYVTVNYLRDTAIQGGLQTAYIHLEEIGWNDRLRAFVDLHEQPLETVFKLYPWEWLFRDQFGAHLGQVTTRWIEPPWKVLLSSKALLAVLWTMFPESPYLLRTAFEPFDSSYVRKPIQGREGANVTMVFDGQIILETGGPYDQGPWIYQEVKPLPGFDGNYPVLGSWLVNGYACGVGIREDRTAITQNTSRFVPHLFEPSAARPNERTQ